MNSESGFFDLISSRHSVRTYKQKDLPKEIIEKILNAVQKAPSAGNLQSYQIFVVTDKEVQKRLAIAAHEQNYLAEASAVFVFCADPQNAAKEYGSRGEQLFCIQDATVACAFAQMASHALGLSSVWIGAFDENQVSEILDVKQLRPVAMLPVGYADETPEITSRRPLNEMIRKI